MCFVEVDLEECLLKGGKRVLTQCRLELTFPDGDAVPSKCGELLDGT